MIKLLLSSVHYEAFSWGTFLIYAYLRMTIDSFIQQAKNNRNYKINRNRSPNAAAQNMGIDYAAVLDSVPFGVPQMANTPENLRSRLQKSGV